MGREASIGVAHRLCQSPGLVATFLHEGVYVHTARHGMLWAVSAVRDPCEALDEEVVDSLAGVDN